MLTRTVRERLERLAEYVEENGAGALRGIVSQGIFSVAQAETYLRFYEGFKRLVQEQSIESGLIPETDPLYGWGYLATHEPSVKVIDQPGFNDFQPDNIPAQGSLEAKRLQSAELLVVRRDIIVPTLPMSIIRATVSPIIIPNMTKQTVISRLGRVRTQVKNPFILERLHQLECVDVKEGVLVQRMEEGLYQVGPANEVI